MDLLPSDIVRPEILCLDRELVEPLKSDASGAYFRNAESFQSSPPFPAYIARIARGEEILNGSMEPFVVHWHHSGIVGTALEHESEQALLSPRTLFGRMLRGAHLCELSELALACSAG